MSGTGSQKDRRLAEMQMMINGLQGALKQKDAMIIRLQQDLNQQAFLEQMTAAALGGYTTHKNRDGDPIDPIEAGKLAMRAAEGVMASIIRAQIERERAEAEEARAQARTDQEKPAEDPPPAELPAGLVDPNAPVPSGIELVEE